MDEIQSCFMRYEKKYLLTREQYRTVRFGMAPYMSPDVYPVYTVSNIYFDTGQYDFIRTSLEKPIYKEKLRMRSYGVPDSRDPVFFEIKKKFDGVVYKRRITMEMNDAAPYLTGAGKGDGSQIGREIDFLLERYRPEPKVYIAYEREAYTAADDSGLRVTFDTALRARSNDVDLRLGSQGVSLLKNDIFLMEIKTAGACPLWLANLLSEGGIFPTSFSKYGTYYKQYVLGGRSAIIQKEVVLSA